MKSHGDSGSETVYVLVLFCLHWRPKVKQIERNTEITFIFKSLLILLFIVVWTVTVHYLVSVDYLICQFAHLFAYSNNTVSFFFFVHSLIFLFVPIQWYRQSVYYWHCLWPMAVWLLIAILFVNVIWICLPHFSL